MSKSEKCSAKKYSNWNNPEIKARMLEGMKRDQDKKALARIIALAEKGKRK